MNDRWDDEQDAWDDPNDDLDDDSEDDDFAAGVVVVPVVASETVPCPACGASVYEDAIRCPVCGEYVSHSAHWTAGRPWWWIALGIVGVVAVLGTMLLGVITGFGL